MGVVAHGATVLRLAVAVASQHGWSMPTDFIPWALSGSTLTATGLMEKWVMLMNRSCCAPGWPQEGIYASFNDDLSNIGGWSSPEKILDDTGWYPQVLGLGPNETDSVSGERARLYIYGHSRWELIFHKDSPALISDSPESMP